MDDSSPENRLTGAFLHVAQGYPELLDQVLSRAGVDLRHTSVHSAETQVSMLPWGRPDGLLVLERADGGLSLLVLETKAVALADDEEPTRHIDEGQQLIRYAKAVTERFPQGAVLAYLTADVAKPVEFARLERLSSSVQTLTSHLCGFSGIPSTGVQRIW